MTSPSTTPGEVMTPAQVAGYLQVHKLTVYRYVREGQLPAVRLGRAVRILKADVDEFLRLHRVANRGRGSIQTAARGRLTDQRPAQPSMRAMRGQRLQTIVWPYAESRLKHDDPLIWSFWGWVARGLH